jgi:hypothetical protein
MTFQSGAALSTLCPSDSSRFSGLGELPYDLALWVHDDEAVVVAVGHEQIPGQWKAGLRGSEPRSGRCHRQAASSLATGARCWLAERTLKARPSSSNGDP